MDAPRDNNEKLLSLLQSDDERNVDLAFQICVGLQGKYDFEVVQALRQDALRCIKYDLESKYVNSLTQLHLDFKKLTLLAEEIGAFKLLTTLNLEGNYLSDLPSQLTSLKRLTVSSQNLVNLSP